MEETRQLSTLIHDGRSVRPDNGKERALRKDSLAAADLMQGKAFPDFYFRGAKLMKAFALLAEALRGSK